MFMQAHQAHDTAPLIRAYAVCAVFRPMATLHDCYQDTSSRAKELSRKAVDLGETILRSN